MLYRGERKDNGEWVEGFLFDDGLMDSDRIFIGSLIIEDYKGLSDDKWDIIGTCFYEVIPETVGQCTGLEIKGVKVFDGDIINVFPNNRKMFVFWNEETLSWEIADVGTQLNEVNHLINCMSLGELGVEECFENEIQSEVVGNIYDSKDNGGKRC